MNSKDLGPRSRNVRKTSVSRTTLTSSCETRRHVTVTSWSLTGRPSTRSHVSNTFLQAGSVAGIHCCFAGRSSAASYYCANNCVLTTTARGGFPAVRAFLRSSRLMSRIVVMIHGRYNSASPYSGRLRDSLNSRAESSANCPSASSARVYASRRASP